MTTNKIKNHLAKTKNLLEKAPTVNPYSMEELSSTKGPLHVNAQDIWHGVHNGFLDAAGHHIMLNRISGDTTTKIPLGWSRMYKGGMLCVNWYIAPAHDDPNRTQQMGFAKEIVNGAFQYADTNTLDVSDFGIIKGNVMGRLATLKGTGFSIVACVEAKPKFTQVQMFPMHPNFRVAILQKINNYDFVSNDDEMAGIDNTWR